MALRSQEPERISRMRTVHAARVTLAERILDFAEDFFMGAAPEMNEVVAVLLAFYHRIVVTLWGIVVLAERGLPTSSLTRELLESLISVAYIANAESPAPGFWIADPLEAAERAQRCIEYAPIKTARAALARLQFPFVLDSLRLLIGENRMMEMMGRKETWAGRSLREMTGSLEAMAWRDEIPRKVYNTATAFLEFCSNHGLGVDEILASASDTASWSPAIDSVNPSGLRSASDALPGADQGRRLGQVPLRVLCPDTVPPCVSDNWVTDGDLPESFDEWQLMLPCYWTLAALQIVGRKLGVDRKAEIEALHGEIEKLWGNAGS